MYMYKWVYIGQKIPHKPRFLGHQLHVSLSLKQDFHENDSLLHALKSLPIVYINYSNH
ncbi:hypothetical protein Scep_007751 [Stephania cephalantha]|uniref:Uncharacterized protein n=1 Tax=Stephania cephalantha TaxID=152367 RepID=A0AAP0KC67_9MAGN